ncbi:MAG: hypothetical protein R3C41_18710 [Calditrichia bacterium]
MPVVFNPANTEAPDYLCGYVIIQPEFRIGDQSIQEKCRGERLLALLLKIYSKKEMGRMSVRPKGIN